MLTDVAFVKVTHNFSFTIYWFMVRPGTVLLGTTMTIYKYSILQHHHALLLSLLDSLQSMNNNTLQDFAGASKNKTRLEAFRITFTLNNGCKCILYEIAWRMNCTKKGAAEHGVT
jgi:hypothetical protein